MSDSTVNKVVQQIGGAVVDPKTRTHVYKFMTLSPKDYYLIPGVNAIKLVEWDQLTYTPVFGTITRRLLFNPG